MNNKILIGVLIVLASLVLLYIKTGIKNKEMMVCPQDAKQCGDGSYVGREGKSCQFKECPLSVDKSNLIKIFNIKSGDKINSSLLVKGEARGYWFFEASFPVELRDSNNNLIKQFIAEAKDEWMTEDFVPFEVVLDFNNVSASGFLVFKKSNPSDLPEKNDELKIPVSF